MTRGDALRAASAVAALALIPLGGCGAAESGRTVTEGGRNLVSYSREGGIRFQRSTLVVLPDGEAKVRTGGCAARFRLGGAEGRRLRRALRQADMGALAGKYPAPAGAADLVAETIVVGDDVVRIGDFASLPPRARGELSPLVSALGALLTRAGQCASR